MLSLLLLTVWQISQVGLSPTGTYTPRGAPESTEKFLCTFHKNTLQSAAKWREHFTLCVTPLRELRVSVVNMAFFQQSHA